MLLLSDFHTEEDVVPPEWFMMQTTEKYMMILNAVRRQSLKYLGSPGTQPGNRQITNLDNKMVKHNA